MNISLKELNINDGIKEIELLKSFLPSENGFERNATDEDLKSIENFKIWIKSRINASNGIGLKEGRVSETIYWIILEETPVGLFKVRHCLNEALRHNGGHVGYGISSKYRNKGIMTKALSLLLPLINEKHNIERVLISIEAQNIASQNCVNKNGGTFDHEENGKYFYWLKTVDLIHG